MLKPMETDISPTGTHRSHRFDEHPPPPPPSRVEDLLVKQGKQIRALYELQKIAYEKLTSVSNQIKKLSNSKNTELSRKVFSVSNHNNISYLISLYY